MAGHSPSKTGVYAAYDPAIHVFRSSTPFKAWMPGTRPGMTDIPYFFFVAQ